MPVMLSCCACRLHHSTYFYLSCCVLVVISMTWPEVGLVVVTRLVMVMVGTGGMHCTAELHALR